MTRYDFNGSFQGRGLAALRKTMIAVFEER
jgi:hypothetical protein